MCIRRILKSGLGFGVLLFASASVANPIAPASMPREDLTIQIDGNGHVEVEGVFTFDSIPRIATQMFFPLPPINAGEIEVFQNGIPISWTMTGFTYPTRMIDYPELSMIEWSGPFPQKGAVFRVKYQHDLFLRDGNWIFVYPLSSEPYFQTDRRTTANFKFSFPFSFSLVDIKLDEEALDPSLYTLGDTTMDMTLISSTSSPFRASLIMAFAVTEPGSFWLLLGPAVFALIRRPRCVAHPASHPA